MEYFLDTLPLLALYAETHFRFGGWTPNFLFKREPEVIFDMPRRIESNFDVPILLQFNDTIRFPFTVENIVLALSQNGESRIVFEKNDIKEFELKHFFSSNAPSFLFNISKDEFTEGSFSIACRIDIKVNHKRKTIINNNLRTSKKAPLTGTFTSSKLPGADKCVYGDMHVHSNFTESHVEFCPPVIATDIAAKSLGLDFINIIDHSYDLSCMPHNYLENDSNLLRWSEFKKEISDTSFKTIVLSGEEVSTYNSDGKVVHLGAVEISNFIFGTADGARREINKKESTVPINKAIDSINSDKGLSFAAHPGAGNGIMQKIFLNRGSWKNRDLDNKLHAFQAVNSGFDTGWYKARKMWIKALLEGKKLPLLAGNDCHGDFNRYISLNIPFFSVSENDNRFLGFGRTGLYNKKCNSPKDVVETIKNGNTFITTGPYIEITDKEGKNLIDNKELDFETLIIKGESTPEFGKLSVLRIFTGDSDLKKEKLFKLKTCINSFNYSLNIDKSVLPKKGYLRAEVICQETGTSLPSMAATSPVYY